MTAQGDGATSHGAPQTRRGWNAGRRRPDATVPVGRRRRNRLGLRKPDSSASPEPPPNRQPDPPRHVPPVDPSAPTERIARQSPPTRELPALSAEQPAHEGPRERVPPREFGRSDGPRKLTVTRVAALRSKQLTRDGLQHFHRAASADGAGKSGLTALTYATMANYASDAAIAVALANTLFFAAAKGEGQGKVALYLLITIAPFAVIAPLIGPALDRIQRGRRLALAGSFVGRALLAVIMALNFDSWELYPAALGVLVLSKSFGVLRSSVMPRVLPPNLSLMKSNSRITVFGLVGTTVTGAIAGGVELTHQGAALWFSALVMLLGAWLCMRIPAWVEVTEGEVGTTLMFTHADERAAAARPRKVKPRKQLLGRSVLASLWGTGTTRVFTGFITLFIAFVANAHYGPNSATHNGWLYTATLGAIGAAAGLGNFAGNAVGARLHLSRPDLVIIGCALSTLTLTVTAAVIPGLVTATLATLVGASGSALSKVSLDAIMQRDLPEAARASAFGRTETVLQLAWVVGGAFGVLLPPTYWVGFTVIAVLLALGTAQTLLTSRGSTLLPGLGGVRPRRGPAAAEPAR